MDRRGKLNESPSLAFPVDWEFGRSSTPIFRYRQYALSLKPVVNLFPEEPFLCLDFHVHCEAACSWLVQYGDLPF